VSRPELPPEIWDALWSLYERRTHVDEAAAIIDSYVSRFRREARDETLAVVRDELRRSYGGAR
jgi:hypothetical protein